jgi:hypothetical protein
MALCVCLIDLLIERGPVRAENRFFLAEGPLLAGAQGQEIAVFADNEIAMTGYSVGINYDEDVLVVTDVTVDGTVAKGADVLTGRIDVDRGLVGYGVVLDLFGQRVIPPGSSQPILKLLVDAIVDVDTSTEIALEPVPIDPDHPVENVIVDEQGVSVLPEVANVILAIETRRPRILALSDNRGLAGAVFTVLGEFFDQPDLSVTVCGMLAPAHLESDGRTLSVTAPRCDLLGFVQVEVCTVRGCAAVAEGFYYETPPPPVILSVERNRGRPGDLFTVVGENFGWGGLAVTVCGNPAAASLEADEILSVRAPECDEEGFSAVEVCTRYGCDSLPEGFFYESTVPPREFLRGDANGDSRVDISDGIFDLLFLFRGLAAAPCSDAMDFNDDGRLDLADPIYLFNYTFGGGPIIPPPYPGAGLDPTEDELPEC